jgi:hypothetical protein
VLLLARRGVVHSATGAGELFGRPQTVRHAGKRTGRELTEGFSVRVLPGRAR